MNQDVILPMEQVVDYIEHILNMYAERIGNPFRLKKKFAKLYGEDSWQLDLIVPVGYSENHPMASQLYDLMNSVVREDYEFVEMFTRAALNIPRSKTLRVTIENDLEIDPVNIYKISVSGVEHPVEDLIPWTVDPLPYIFTRFRNN